MKYITVPLGKHFAGVRRQRHLGGQRAAQRYGEEETLHGFTSGFSGNQRGDGAVLGPEILFALRAECRPP
jgi:hypothetical protein